MPKRSKTILAFALSGAVMVAISKDSETVKTTLVPLPGGGVVLVGGAF